MGLQLVYTAYLLYVQPMYKSENRHEVLAEYILLLMSYFTLMYTGYIADQGVLKMIGFGEVLACVFIVAVKVIKIFFTTVRSLFFKSYGAFFYCLHRKKF